MQRLFSFDPKKYAATYAAEGFVHIPNGLDAGFFKSLTKQIDKILEGERLKQFAIGDKQQALYEFPDGANYLEQLFEDVAVVCGLDAKELVLSERHLKIYEPDADPNPGAHKDRYASQVSVGFSVRVPEGSTLVLFPYDELDVNPFNASTGLRASLSPDRVPEKALKTARRVEIPDKPGDVVMFRGNRIWHLRSNPAGTQVLYLKLNDYNCDVLGEDPSSADFRKLTEINIKSKDDELEKMIPLIGRRVDYLERRYTRDWDEVAGVVLHGKPTFTIDEDELRALRAMDGRRTVLSIIEEMGHSNNPTIGLQKIRSLAARGAVDLSTGRKGPKKDSGRKLSTPEKVNQFR